MRTLGGMSVYRCTGCGTFNRVREAQGKTPICGRCKERLDTSGAPQNVTGDALQRAIESSPVPVLVDFWADWCGPCRMAAPILDSIARARNGQLVVLKLDTDRHQGAARRHRVQGIPLFVLFADGREISRQTGLLPQGAFESWVGDHARASARD